MTRVLLIVLLTACQLSFGYLKLKARVSSHLSNPASMTYDHEANCFYISNINGNAEDENNSGFITRLAIDEKGKIHTEVIIKGGELDTILNAPKGIYYFRGQLFVADIDTLRIFTENSKGIWEAKRYIKIPGAQFLNDLVIDRRGVLWLTDAGANCLFDLRPPYGQRARRRFFHQKIIEPMGIELHPAADQLWVTCLSEDIIYNIDIEKRKIINRYRTRISGIAGIGSVEKGRVGVVDFANRAYIASFAKDHVIRETINRNFLQKPSSIIYEPVSGLFLVSELKESAISIYVDENESK